MLREASHLAQQYLGDTAAPGNLLDLLQAIYRDRTAPADTAASLDEVIACVGRMTRLPADILDERQGLDLGALSTFFTSRVIGQPEAIDERFHARRLYDERFVIGVGPGHPRSEEHTSELQSH